MKLNAMDTAELCRGLARLLHGGLSLNEGLFLLAEEEQDGMRALLTDMGQAMDLGRSLRDVMEESGAFSPYVCGMVGVGEETGRLEEALEGLADYYGERVRTARQLRSALTYPAMILGLMLLVIGVLLTKVLPVFQSVYASLGVSMTGAAGVLLKIGQGLGTAVPVVLVLLVAVALAGVVVWKRASLREKTAAWFLRKFGDKGILRRFSNARFLRALALGLGSGLPVENALELARGSLDTGTRGADRCEACENGIKAGKDLAEVLAEAGFLSPARSRMLRLGLRSGSGDKVLAELAETVMEEAETSLENAVGRIEPAMVTVCSVLVGAILLTVMLPLLNILSALGG